MISEKHIILPDERQLAYAEYGQPDGHPVLYFHGTPSSRLEPLVITDEVWRQLGLRVIAPDRPGIGGSDFQRKRGFSDWPADVTALADALGLEKFAVLGSSGGGGYATVCAARIPERISAAVLASGCCKRMDSPEAWNNLPAPIRLTWNLARHAPFLLSYLLKMTVNASRDRLTNNLLPADRAIAEQPGRLDAMAQMFHEAIRQGSKGPIWDMRLYVRPFDFRLDEIQMPLTLFHGEQDINVPIALARKMAAELPNARLITYENEAHLSTIANHIDEIAQALVNG